MAAGDKLFYCRAQPTYGGVAVTTAVTFGVGIETDKVDDPGAAGSPGLAEQQLSNRRVKVSVDFQSLAEAFSWLELAAGNFVGLFKGVAGANETVTVKNVVFTDPPGEVMVPAKDGGGKVAVWRITGWGRWASTDTFALMLVWA